MMRLIILLILLFATHFGISQNEIDSAKYAGQPGAFITYYPNGLLHHIGSKKGNTRQGTLHYYFTNDVLSKTIEYTFTNKQIYYYSDAKLVEIVTEYFENGEINKVAKYVNGSPQSFNEAWHENGQQKIENIADPDGIHETIIGYHDNGQMHYRSTQMKNARPKSIDGKTEYWNEKGVKLTESDYTNNVRNGVAKVWNDDGLLLRDCVYENDTLVVVRVWKEDGEQIEYSSKYTPKHTHFHKLYHYRTEVLKEWTTYKVYHIGEDSVVMKFIRYYKGKGEYGYTIVHSDMAQHVSMAYSTSGVVSENKITTQILQIERHVENANKRLFKVQQFNRPLEMGTWISILEFPYDASLKVQEKIMRNALVETKEKMDNYEAGKEYKCDPDNFDKAIPYYLKIPREMLFDSAITTTSFDTTMSGNYRIDYLGTAMYFKGALIEGLEHGTSVLYLNDSVKLFEREYYYGMRHGFHKAYYLTGELAHEAHYHFGRLLELKKYFLTGGVSKHERKGIRGQLRINDEWDKDKYPLAMFWEEEEYVASIRLNADRTLNSYSWRHYEKNIRISHTVHDGSHFMTVDIPKIPNEIIEFKLERHGVTVAGRAWWDPEKQEAILEDDFGKKEKVDPNKISYPVSLPCNCPDWEKHGFFAAPTSNFLTVDDFKKYQHKFHAPSEAISGIFGSPYYNSGREPDKYKKGETYKVNAFFYAAKPIQLFLPDSNGIVFSFEPCKSKYAFIKFYASLSFKVGSPKETTVSIRNPKSLSLTIPNKMLVQVDANYDPIKDLNGAFLPGVFLFNAEQVNYDYKKELDVTYPSFDCAKPMRIGQTNMILEVYDLLPDFSSTWNYETMTEALDKSTRAKELGLAKLTDKFIGAFCQTAAISIPYQTTESNSALDYLQFTAENTLVSANECRTTLISGIVSAEGTVQISLKNGGQIAISKSQLDEILKKCNLSKYKLNFETGKAVEIHIYYQL
ncbi:MAG: hypothetical protein GQ574_12495 [Crocinitomix sp.]|nr:hypothetical protein [Crocinitomix sp.]